MNEYFLNNDFDITKPIFNIEFELHRTHLKQFNINTIEDLFLNAENLFKQSMEDIRLVDISNITQKDIENNTKNRAETLPIWNYIKENYKIDSFLQNQLPLERVKRNILVYSEQKFEIEYIGIIRKAYINNLPLTDDYLKDLYYKAKDTLTKKTTITQLKKDYILVDFIDENKNEKEEFRLLNNGDLIKPIRPNKIVSNLNDYELLVYLDKTETRKNLSKIDESIHYVAHKEALKRGLIKNYKGEELI